MKILTPILLLLLCACTANVKPPIDHQVEQQLNQLRQSFFNMEDGREALASVASQPLIRVDANTQAHEKFKCTRDHNRYNKLFDKTIDIEFEEMDLRDALVEISLLSEIPIIMDDSIEGIVSAHFVQSMVSDVLATLLAVGEYDYRILSHHIFVGSSEPTSSSYHQLSATCIYRPGYLDALSLVTFLPEVYQRYIKINQKHGFIAITAPNSIMHRIQHDIVLFDLPQKQVVLELSIIEVSREALEILGLDWQSIKNKASSVYNQSLGAVSYGGRTVTLPSMKARHFLDAVNALNRTGHAQIKTMPSIVVLEGKEAKFRSMQTVWSPQVMASSHKREAIHFGVEMNVVTHVSELGHMQLEIKNASVSDFVVDGYGLPTVVQHSLSSSVSIRDGESLILGGLLQKKRRSEGSGIPLLQDFPLVGGLFRNTIHKMVDSEILIILQPRIIRG